MNNTGQVKYISHIDGKEFKSQQLLMRHNTHVHRVSKEETIQHLKYDGQQKFCKCGCGIRMMYNPTNCDLADFAKGHFARTDGNPTKRMKGTDEAKEHMRKAYEKRKQLVANDEWKQWNKGLTAETDERMKNIQEFLKQRIMDPEARARGIETRNKWIQELKNNGTYDEVYNAHSKIFWAKPENRYKQSIKTTNRLIANDTSFKTSKFEQDVLDFLTKNNINFKHSYRISTKEYNKVYDFLLDNNILLESDGDFLHCNPVKFPNGPIYDDQIRHVANDKIKNQLAIDQGFKLIRIWLSDFYKDNNILLKMIEDANL